jgi:pyruvate dehydrogenase E1 component beta subunit
MIRGASAVFFMKQLDFLLLGIDQLVNTYNIIRNGPSEPRGSFTIMPIIVDNGYQGVQSSSNNFADFCSIARIAGYTVTNQRDAETIIPAHMVSPGFRIIGISHRLFRDEAIAPQTVIYRNADATLFQYTDGVDATIACFNFSFPQGWHLQQAMKEQGLAASLFNVNAMTPVDWSPIVESARLTQNLVILDDSKSQNLSCFSLLAEVRGAVQLKRDFVVTRQLGGDWLTPVSDQLLVPNQEIVDALHSRGSRTGIPHGSAI